MKISNLQNDPEGGADSRPQPVDSSNLRETEDNQLRWTRRILLLLGGVFVLTGTLRQWPLAGKTYMEFIEGDGYLSLMLGLILIILGGSMRLFFGPADSEE